MVCFFYWENREGGLGMVCYCVSRRVFLGNEENLIFGWFAFRGEEGGRG